MDQWLVVTSLDSWLVKILHLPEKFGSNPPLVSLLVLNVGNEGMIHHNYFDHNPSNPHSHPFPTFSTSKKKTPKINLNQWCCDSRCSCDSTINGSWLQESRHRGPLMSLSLPVLPVDHRYRCPWSGTPPMRIPKRPETWIFLSPSIK